MIDSEKYALTTFLDSDKHNLRGKEYVSYISMEGLTWPTKGRNLNQGKKPRQNLWIVLNGQFFTFVSFAP